MLKVDEKGEDFIKIDAKMLTQIIPKPIKNKKAESLVPENETARLLLLKQAKILDTNRQELEYDRFAGLAQRILNTKYAFISFIDFERQWIKSSIGVSLSNPNVDRRDSVDAHAMFPDAPEVLVVMDLTKDERYRGYLNPFGIEGEIFRFYVGAVIIVDGFRLGVLSVVDTKPREFITLENRQNLADLASAVGNLVKESRQRHLRYRKERANLMLGLNHNLRTPLMSLTLVTEMLRGEVKQLAISKRDGHQSPSLSVREAILLDETMINSRINRSSSGVDLSSLAITGLNIGSNGSDDSATGNTASPIGYYGSGSPMHHFHQNNHNSTMNHHHSSDEEKMQRQRSRSTSRQHTPDVPCMNLLGDLQGSLQQLGLLVEMGLVLGKISSGMSVLADGTYDSILCDVLKIYEKVQALTQRIGRAQNVLWYINKMHLEKGKHFSHPDVLMFVLISTLTQVLPHADMIKVRGSFLPVEEVTRLVDDEDAVQMVSAIAEMSAPSVVIGRVGLLMTELEIYGDPANLYEIVSKLNLSSTNDSSNDGSSCRSNDTNSDNSDDGMTSHSSSLANNGARSNNKKIEEYINADVEEFGGSLFALGSLLENVMGGSSFVMKNHGCTYSFSIPCRVEMDPVINLHFQSDDDASSVGSVENNDEFNNSEVKMRKGVVATINEEKLPTRNISFATEVDVKTYDTKSATNTASNTTSNTDNEGREVKELRPKGMRRMMKNTSETDFVVYVKEAVLKPRSEPTENVKIVAINSLVNEVSTKKASSPAENMPKPPSALSLKDMIGLELPSYKRILKVLLVDDSVTVQKVMGIWLKKKNCLVASALNGMMALEMMKTTAYDIVFMDFLMPVMDGLTCMQRYHEFVMTGEDDVTHQVASLPKGSEDQWTIGLSATALPRDEEDAFDAGMHMFCAKPVDTTALGYILEAKRMGLDYRTLARLVKSNRNSTMTPQQQDDAVDMLVPKTEQSGSASGIKERAEMKVNVENNFLTNIFGGFHFPNFL